MYKDVTEYLFLSIPGLGFLDVFTSGTGRPFFSVKSLSLEKNAPIFYVSKKSMQLNSYKTLIFLNAFYKYFRRFIKLVFYKLLIQLEKVLKRVQKK